MQSEIQKTFVAACLGREAVRQTFDIRSPSQESIGDRDPFLQALVLQVSDLWDNATSWAIDLGLESSLGSAETVESRPAVGLESGAATESRGRD
jgi:hypothetical protein